MTMQAFSEHFALHFFDFSCNLLQTLSHFSKIKARVLANCISQGKLMGMLMEKSCKCANN